MMMGRGVVGGDCKYRALMIAEVKFGGWTKIAINSGGLKYLHANTYVNHLDDEWDLCLEQGLGDHGWGALLKASAEKEKHFSLDIGVLVIESLCSLLLKSTESGL